MTRSTIASLAIIKINFEHGRDYIDNFVPFVVECARLSKDEVISLPSLQAQMRDQFGISIPLNPLRQIIKRATSQNFFYSESGILYRNRSTCDSTDFARIREQVTQKQNHVIVEFQAFAKKRYTLELTDDESEQHLLSFVSDNQLDIVYAAVEGSVLPATKSTIQSTYMVADFVSHCQANDSQLFADIETIVKGSLLVNALYMPDQSKIKKKFKNTSVYFDTSFLIFSLGYAGTDRQAPCTELLTLLKLYGAQLRAFSHTIEEVKGILDACAARIRRHETRDSFGPAMEYFVSEGLKSTDIDLYSARLETNLVAMGFKIVDKPPYDHVYNIDEKALETQLSGEIGYRNPKALEHDVDSVAAVARARRGHHSHSFEDSGAVFVTANSDLARSVRSFFAPELPPGATSLCITDYALGNLLWLKNPTQAPQLPKKYLIADVYAAMQPSDDLWKVYLAEIARLEDKGSISSDDYMLLRHYHVARRALMEMTKGSQQALTEGTVIELLEVARRNIRAEVIVELERERNQRMDLEAQLNSKLEFARGMDAKYSRFASKAASIIAESLFAFIFLLFIIGTVYSFPWSLPAFGEYWKTYVLPAAEIIVLVFVVIHMKSGKALDEIKKSLKRRISALLLTRLRSWFGEPLQ